MKKFSRCALILILVTIISGIAGFVYANQTTIPMYSSTTRLYVVPGASNEASVRAKDGGLNDDFMIIFKSNVVISAAQTKAGTTEDIAQYLTISSPDNSNIIEITCTNPDQNTAKKYADAVAVTAIKTTSIIPVESIQILSEGTSDGIAKKLGVWEKTLTVTGIAAAVVLFAEIIVVLVIGAFKNKEDDYDDELEYERRFGRYAALPISTVPTSIDSKSTEISKNSYKSKEENYTSDSDVLADIDTFEADEEIDTQLDDESMSMEPEDAIVQAAAEKLAKTVAEITREENEKEPVMREAAMTKENVNEYIEEDDDIVIEDDVDDLADEAETWTETGSATIEPKSAARIFGRIHK